MDVNDFAVAFCIVGLLFALAYCNVAEDRIAFERWKIEHPVKAP